MATILDRLTTILDFKTDTAGVQQAEASLAALKSNSIRVFAAVGAIFGGGFFLNQIAEAADDAGDFAKSIGVAVEQLSEMEYVVQLNGGSIGGLRGSLFSLNATLGAAERGMKRALKTFNDYHISLKNAEGANKTATEIMTELNRKFQVLSASKQIDLASKLGLDQGTIAMLQMLPAEYDRNIARARELGVLTQEDADRAGAYSDALIGMKRALGSVGHTIGAEVFPLMTRFANTISGLISFLRSHMRFFKVLGIVIMGIGTAWAYVRSEAILAQLAMFAVPAAIAAAVAAVALLIEDLVAFWQGQESIMGDIEKRWPQAGRTMRATIDFILAGWDLLKETLANVAKGFNNMIRLFEMATNKLESFGQTMRKWGGAVREFADWFTVDSPNISSAVNLRAFPQAVPFIPPTGGSSASVSTGDINISVPGGDAKAIAASITDVLGTELRNTVQNFDSGVKR